MNQERLRLKGRGAKLASGLTGSGWWLHMGFGERTKDDLGHIMSAKYLQNSFGTRSLVYFSKFYGKQHDHGAKDPEGAWSINTSNGV